MRTIPCAGCKNQCFSEMLGTYLLVLLGPGSVVAASLLRLEPAEALALEAAVFGCTVASVILSLGRFSGAHINPAITVGSTLSGMSDRKLLLPYVVFQVAGGVLAGLSLRLALGALGPVASLGSTKLAVSVSPTEGVVLEVIGTFVLAASALTASSFLRNPVKQAILVGGTLFLLILLIGPLTGASFNPVRSLGPSLFSGYFDNQSIYYVGPVIGGLCAGLAFRQARKSYDKKPKKLDLVCVC